MSFLLRISANAKRNNVVVHSKYHIKRKEKWPLFVYFEETYAIRRNHSSWQAFYSLLQLPSEIKETFFNKNWRHTSLKSSQSCAENKFLYRTFAINIRHLWFSVCRHIVRSEGSWRKFPSPFGLTNTTDLTSTGEDFAQWKSMQMKSVRKILK